MRISWPKLPIPFWKQAQQADKKSRIILLIAFLLVLAVSSYATIHFFSQKKALKDPESPLENALSLELDPNQVDEDDKKNLAILLVGYGGAGHDGAYLTDVMQILYFDFEKSQIRFISLPRDLEVSLNDGSSRKLNSVVAANMSDKTSFLEASQKLKNVASQISGLPIKYVIAVDFVGFQRLIGYGLDGIDVEVSQTFEDPWYPIAGEQLNPCGHSPEEIAQLTAEYSGFELEKQFACRYEQLYFPQGMVKMEGGDALKYVRSRHSSSDFDRSRRQAEVLLGIRRKLFSLNALQDVPKYFQALSQYVSTDLNLEIVEYLAPLFLDADQFSSKSIVLSTENVLSSQKNAAGAFVLVPQMGHNQWQGVKDFIQKEIQ